MPNISVFFLCVLVRERAHQCRCPWWPTIGIIFSGARVPGSCEPRCQELNSGPSQQRYELSHLLCAISPALHFFLVHNFFVDPRSLFFFLSFEFQNCSSSSLKNHYGFDVDYVESVDCLGHMLIEMGLVLLIHELENQRNTCQGSIHSQVQLRCTLGSEGGFLDSSHSR